MTPFDLSPDERPVWVAETSEQLQALDEGLVQLELAGNDPQLLQTIFRAAHTLKGAAGMIGHERMAELTHSLETILDRWRKGTVAISSDWVDLCLEALDALKRLHVEVSDPQAAPTEVKDLVARLTQLGNASASHNTVTTSTPTSAGKNGNTYDIRAEIAPHCPASAARAYQIFLALQNLGEILHLDPPQSALENATPVQQVLATLYTPHSLAQVRKTLADIADVVQWQISEEKRADLKLNLAPEKTVRTSVERLDHLMNLLGELVTDRNRLNQQRHKLEQRFHNDGQVDDLTQTVLHLGRITDQLQEEVMRLRMLPIANLFGKFPRLVRDLARKAGKQAELVIRGEETELDRSVIEQIGDPLIHLLRNAVDHGLETPAERQQLGKPERGTLLLTARHEESRIILTIEDDGAGIDLDKVRMAAMKRGLLTAAEAEALTAEETLDLIYLPGLSTSNVTTDVSGRGVGMDIVRTNLERLNGQIAVDSWPGRGTRFQISLPLTLAIIPTLLVRAEHVASGSDGAWLGLGRPDNTLAIPLSAVMETLRLARHEIHTVRGKPIAQLRGHVLPLAPVQTVLGLPPRRNISNAYEYVVAVRWGKLELGLMVDELLGEQELVIKALGTLVGEAPGIAGAAILGDGQVALVMDVPGVFKLAGV